MICVCPLKNTYHINHNILKQSTLIISPLTIGIRLFNFKLRKCAVLLLGMSECLFLDSMISPCHFDPHIIYTFNHYLDWTDCFTVTVTVTYPKLPLARLDRDEESTKLLSIHHNGHHFTPTDDRVILHYGHSIISIIPIDTSFTVSFP